MGVFTYEFENSSVIAPARLFRSLILDADNLIPKVVPQAVKNTEIVSGMMASSSDLEIWFHPLMEKTVVHKTL